MATSGSRSLWLSDAKLATIYRRGTYPTVNTPPTVTLTSPAQNAVYTAPATVVLSATASDIGGSISRVEFYSGSQLLSVDSTAPYSFSWANLPAGMYRVCARAYDNLGAAVTSQPINPTFYTG